MAGNKFLIPDKNKLLKNKLDKLSTSLQGSLKTSNFATKEQLMFEAIKLVSNFYKYINEPQLQKIDILPDDLPNQKLYNQVWQQLLDDLITIFTELENIETLTIANFNFIVTEANRLTARLKSVSSKLGDYILYSLNPTKDAVYFKDSFNNISKIEIGSAFLNEKECELSQAEGIITLPIDKEKNPNILIKEIPVINTNSNGVLGNNQEIGVEWNGNLTTLLDYNSDTWVEYEKVVTEEDKEPLILDLTLGLGDPKIINHIQINPNNFGTRTVINIDTIETSLDGQVYTSVKDDIPIIGLTTQDEENIFDLCPSTSKFAGQGLYTFTPRKVKYVRFVFKQSEPYIIETSSGQKLRYAIGIRDINIKGFSFQSKGEIISLPFNSTQEIRKILLSTGQNPAEFSELASIQYFITPDNGSTWHEIQPKEFTGPVGVVGTPEILEFNGSSQNTINTSAPVRSFCLKTKMTRNDDMFTSESSTFKKEIQTRSELHSVPDSSPFNFELEKPPVKDTIVVVDPMFGSRGLEKFPYIIGHTQDRLDLSTYRLPMKLIPRPMQKVLDGGKYTLKSVSALDWVHVEVGGERWDHATKPLTEYTADWVAGNVDKVFTFNPNTGVLQFGNNFNSVSPKENAPITMWFEAENLYFSNNKDKHIAKLDFPTSNNKTDFIIKRYDKEKEATQVLPRKATIIRLSHENITDLTGLYSQFPVINKKTFLNGKEELTAPEHWSIDAKEGIIYLYTPTSDSQDISVSYKYQPFYTLTKDDWDWATADILRDSVSIKKSGWETISKKDENICMENNINLLDLSKMSVVKDTLTFSATDSGGEKLDDETSPFLKEVDFTEGITQWEEEVSQTVEAVSSLVAGDNIFTLGEKISSSSQYIVTFSNKTVFNTEMGSWGDVISSGQYYVERNASNPNYGKVRVKTSSSIVDPGTITYFYINPEIGISTGLYCVDYKNGRIYTQRLMNSTWTVKASFEYTDFRAEYKIARILDLDDYNIDVTKKTISIKDKEIINHLMIPHTGMRAGGAYYLVNYDYIKKTREDVEGLKEYFTPVLKDYTLKVLPKGNIY